MTETINRIGSIWFDWQWAMLWQTAVLIGLVAVIDRLIHKRAWPQLRYTLWLLVLVKLVLPPTLTSPLSLTSRIPAWTQRAMAAGTPTLAHPADNPSTETLSASPTSLSTTEAPSSIKPVAANPAEAQPVKDQPVQTRPEAVAAGGSALSWTVYAMGVWLAGVVALAAGLHLRLRQLSTEHSVSQPQDVPRWFEGLVAQTAAELGLRRVPQTVFTTRVCCPAVFGVFRPVLLLPADRLPTTQQEARHVLLHELAHIKRGDLPAHAAYMVLVTVYWFNPLLWLIRKHLQNLRELCCDATVARHLREETAAYRETLLETGRALLARPVDPGLGLLGLFENSGWLPVRLQWLQKKTWRRPWLRRASVAAVALLMLCCILPMASKAAGERSSDQSFKVALPGGGTIELIGVRKTGTDEWWRPDGGPLPESPYDFSEETYRSDLYEFALRYENLPEGSSGEFDIERHLCGGTIPMWYRQVRKAGKPVEGVTYAIAGPEQGTEATMLTVYLASGDWTTDRFYPRTSDDGWLGGVHSSPTLGAVAFAMPYDKDGRTYATVFHTTNDPHKHNVRLTALDVANVEHPPAFQNGGWSAAGLATTLPRFDLPLEDIAGFNLQTRPYTRIEFRNVSLHPGKFQKVEIVTTPASRPAVAEVKEEVNIPEGFSSFREFSAQTLQAFHIGCTDYLKEHPGSDLPKRPWSLKFRLPKQVFYDGHYQDAHIEPVAYVTGAGYFRPGGFPSLKREDFESSEANRTPILYSKSLLEAEAGKGTNVLFGDGHIEWVTAEELNRLKPRPRP